MAASVLSLHAAYIGWVIFGAFFTRGRPRLAALHVATLVYGMTIEICGFWCPLTALEEWLEVRGNVPAYRGPFLLHYLDAVVYPDIPRIFSLLVLAFGIYGFTPGVSVSDIRWDEKTPPRGFWECGFVLRRGS
jgi:hypothetical protein